MPVTLDEIVAVTRTKVAERKGAADLSQLARAADRHRPRGFRRSLERMAAENGTAIIAELKQASPSRGVIRANLHVGALARQFEKAGAAALSVLTEEQYFQGSLGNLCEASAATELPCLRKDFIVDEFQLVEAKANQADAVLLIAAIFDDDQLRAFSLKSHELGLDVLCEVHDKSELARAVVAGCDMIGVNSRDLRSFKVDLETALALGPKMPASVLRVAESGIQSGKDINRLRDAGFQAFLIGESLMKADSPSDELRALIAEAQRCRGKAQVRG